jgi:hypothetical protein
LGRLHRAFTRPEAVIVQDDGARAMMRPISGNSGRRALILPTRSTAWRAGV